MQVSTSLCSSWSPTRTVQLTRSTTYPPISNTRRCSSNVNLSGQQPAEPDGWVTPCGSTCQEATSRSGLSDSLVVRLPLIDLSRQQPSSLDSARRDLASIISG